MSDIADRVQRHLDLNPPGYHELTDLLEELLRETRTLQDEIADYGGYDNYSENESIYDDDWVDFAHESLDNQREIMKKKEIKAVEEFLGRAGG